MFGGWVWWLKRGMIWNNSNSWKGRVNLVDLLPPHPHSLTGKFWQAEIKHPSYTSSDSGRCWFFKCGLAPIHTHPHRLTYIAPVYFAQKNKFMYPMLPVQILMSQQHSTTINDLWHHRWRPQAKFWPSLTKASGPSAREVSLKVRDVAEFSVTQSHSNITQDLNDLHVCPQFPTATPKHAQHHKFRA